MKLCTKSKNELRDFIEEKIIDFPENQKLQLDSKILEDLLFETITIDKEKGIILKLPVWSGNFLKKIDLSQVDFSNVSWAILSGLIYRLSAAHSLLSSWSVVVVFPEPLGPATMQSVGLLVFIQRSYFSTLQCH